MASNMSQPEFQTQHQQEASRIEKEDSVSFFDPELCVEIVDSMGKDHRIVNAAKVSFSQEIRETVPLTERSENLLRYLAANGHNSPFFHVMVYVRLRMPIYVAREWFRHTVGFARNEVSRRYVDKGVQCFVPEYLRDKHDTRKQGSRDSPAVHNEECLEGQKQIMELCIKEYRKQLEKGIAPELARGVLPQSMMTEFVETASLAAYARLVNLRDSENAMFEIRQIARVLSQKLSEKWPVTWKALMEESPEKTAAKNAKAKTIKALREAFSKEFEGDDKALESLGRVLESLH